MEFFLGMSVGRERKESTLDQREITDDVLDLIREGLLTGGRHAQIERVAGSGNQLAILEEDGSGAILTIRGPMTKEMRDGGARSMVGGSHADYQDLAAIQRAKAAEEWASTQDGDDG